MRKTSGESEWVQHKMSMIKVFSSNLMTSDERYSHICRIRYSQGVQNLVNFTSPEDTKNKTQNVNLSFIFHRSLSTIKKCMTTVFAFPAKTYNNIPLICKLKYSDY